MNHNEEAMLGLLRKFNKGVRSVRIPYRGWFVIDVKSKKAAQGVAHDLVFSGAFNDIAFDVNANGGYFVNAFLKKEAK